MRPADLTLRKYYPCKSEIINAPKQLDFREVHNCTRKTPCGSMACAACGHAARQWFKKVVNHVYEKLDAPDLSAVTMVLPEFICDENALTEIDLKKITRRFRDKITKASLNDRPWIGVCDLSLNIKRSPLIEKNWCIHAMLLTPRLSNFEKANLRRQLSTCQNVPRPLNVKDVHDLEGLLHYMFKADFNVRESYTDSTGRKNTRSFPLNGSAKTNFMEIFAGAQHRDRLITIGCKRQGGGLTFL